MANPAQRRGDCMWLLLQVNGSKIVLNIWVMTRMALFRRKVNVPLISGAKLPQKTETRLSWHDARADLHNFTTFSLLFRMFRLLDFRFHVALPYLTLQGLGPSRLHSYIIGTKLYWLFKSCPAKLEKNNALDRLMRFFNKFCADLLKKKSCRSVWMCSQDFVESAVVKRFAQSKWGWCCAVIWRRLKRVDWIIVLCSPDATHQRHHPGRAKYGLTMPNQIMTLR